jgi:riboflavin kinase / FMN adenylyltransferase
MRVIRHLGHHPKRLGRVVLTLGNFDGVHLGHQAILGTALDVAHREAARAVVLTFEPHPMAVLVPDRAPPIIQPLHDRLLTLRRLGIDVTVVQRFTRRFAALEPEAFIHDFLLANLDLVHVVVGYNVNFGRHRAGSAETLQRDGARHGFGVDVVGPVLAGEEQVSSSALRDRLAQGAVAEARRLLGRPYALRGRVVAGDRRGRTMGFPTANLHVRSGVLLPADGVYAVVAEVGGRRWPAVLNIGVRPTFGGRRRTVEVHLLDFDQDLYGHWLVVHAIERLRGETSFAGVDALRAAIEADVERARRVLAGSPDLTASGG